MDLLFIILFVILFIVYFTKNNLVEEGFENTFDNIYAKIYDVVFDHKQLYENDIKFIEKYINKKQEHKILDAGCGTAKHYNLLNKKYTTIGVDISPEFLKYAHIRCPEGKFINKNFIDENIFKSEEFTMIICLLDSLYHNNFDGEIDKILENFYYWLQPNGYFCIHIFDRSKLDPGPREFTQYYKDKKGVKHGLTYFNKFTHDAYWKPINNKSVKFIETIILEDGRKKNKNTKLYIPQDKTELISKIAKSGFKLIDINKVDNDIELCIFKKIKFDTQSIKI